MPKLVLPRVRCNHPGLEDVLNSFAEAIERAVNKEFTVGRGLRNHEHELGLLLESDSDEIGDISADVPWTPFISGTSLTLFPGTLNRLLPSNIFTTFTFTATGVQYVKLHAVTDGVKVTGVTVVVDSTAPTSIGDIAEGTAPSAFDVLIIAINNSRAFQIETGPLEFQPVVAGYVTRTVTSGAQEPFTRQFAWSRQ